VCLIIERAEQEGTSSAVLAFLQTNGAFFIDLSMLNWIWQSPLQRPVVSSTTLCVIVMVYSLRILLTIQGLHGMPTCLARGGNIANRIRDEFANYFVSPEGEVPWQLQKI
jgi:hypothetical protein